MKVRYKVGKRGKAMELSGDDMQRIVDRLRSIPVHFKRIRWFGVFSDGQRGQTMESLGLEVVEVADKEDGDGEGWVREGESARFVRYEAEGVVLREVQRDEQGDIIRELYGKNEFGGLLYREKLGLEFVVPDTLIDYRPSGVSNGNRKRWRKPGGG